MKTKKAKQLSKTNQQEWEISISNMFNDIAKKYEKINTSLSLGMDIRWRKLLIKRLKQNYKTGAILDVGCGPGSLAKLAKKKNIFADFISMDISPKMLEIAAINGYSDKIICASASTLPCKDKQFGAIISAFVLRNLPNLNLFYQEAHRILHDDGVMILLDLTRPTLPLINFFHSLYMKIALPLNAKIFGSNIDAYKYLDQSIQQCYQPKEMKNILKKNGFKNIKIDNFCLGIVTLYTISKKK